MLIPNQADLNFFNENGYITKDIFSNNEDFLILAEDLRAKIKKYLKINLNEVKKLGGYKSGNLNFISKEHSNTLIYLLNKNNLKNYFNFLTKDNICDYEIIIGGNLNFPNSKNQFFHTDGNWDPKMIIINIATINISEHNGPMEIIAGSHKYNYPYWKFFLKNFFFKKKKIILNKGEIIIREHRLWHRGSTNNSNQTREMMGIMFIKKGLRDNKVPVCKDNSLLVFGNIFGISKKEKIKEFVFLHFRPLFSLYKIIISIFK